MLFLISGAPATGKSSAVKKLNEVLKNFECHDSDEIMVKTGTKRRRVNEEWVQKALDAQKNGKVNSKPMVGGGWTGRPPPNSSLWGAGRIRQRTSSADQTSSVAR